MTSFVHTLAKAVLTEIAAVLSRTSTLTSSAIDLADYEGEVLVLLEAGAATAGTNPTLDVKVQDCATSDGSFADVTGYTFTQVTSTASHQKLIVDTNKVARYIKLVGTLGGTNTPTFPFGLSLIGNKKYS